MRLLAFEHPSVRVKFLNTKRLLSELLIHLVKTLSFWPMFEKLRIGLDCQGAIGLCHILSQNNWEGTQEVCDMMTHL